MDDFSNFPDFPKFSKEKKKNVNTAGATGALSDDQNYVWALRANVKNSWSAERKEGDVKNGRSA